MVLALGAFLGFISVALGAFAEHGLKGHVSAEHVSFFMTAIRYNQVHAAVITAIGVATFRNNSNHILRQSAYILIAGTIIFSFSIYAGVLLAYPNVFALTPLGGITIMLGWLWLCVTAIRYR